MKTYNLFFIVFVVGLFFIASCTKSEPSMQSMEMKKETGGEDSEFKQMCIGAGYEWMLMKPTKDGKINKEAESCLGCMVEGIEHVCDKEKFQQFIPLK